MFIVESREKFISLTELNRIIANAKMNSCQFGDSFNATNFIWMQIYEKAQEHPKEIVAQLKKQFPSAFRPAIFDLPSFLFGKLIKKLKEFWSWLGQYSHTYP